METFAPKENTGAVMPAEERQDIDSMNDETFGDGAVEGDWETPHYIMTGDTHGGESPQLPSGSHTQEELVPDMAKLKIKELWPSTPQSVPHDSIWSSPELPVRPIPGDSPSIPPGSKIMSLEELERELTHSPPSNSSTSTSPRPQGSTPILPHPQSSSPSLSPAHHHHLLSGYPPPPPGIIQHPPPGLPHPLPPRGMPPMMMWPPHMQGRGPPPQSAFRPLIPPPNIPLLRHGILTPGHLIQIPPNVQQQRGPFPMPPGGGMPPFRVGPPPPHMYPAHPLFNHLPPQPAPCKSKRSEYLDEMRADGSGFMTQKEKDWVIKIQLVQLRSPDPENEDYYYQNYMKRKSQAKHAQLMADSSSEDLDSSPTSSPSRTRPLPEIAPPRTYKPKEFQGTLGKLSVSSIAAPRKTIDVPLNVEGAGKEVGGAGLESYVKKRQALIVIEKLYSLVLLLEELERRGVSGVEEREREDLLTRKEETTAKAFALLRLKLATETSSKNDDAMLLLITSYRKGKRVLKRILPFLDVEQACAVVLALSRHLPSIIKKDAGDQVLPELDLSVISVLSSLNLDLINKCILAILEGSTSSSSSSPLLRVCMSEFGAKLLLALVRRGQETAATLGEGSREELNEKWLVLLSRLHNVIVVYQDKLTSNKAPSAASQLLQCLAGLT